MASFAAANQITVKALYDYRSQHEDELCFCKHAIICNVKKEDDGWWRGDYGGQRQLLFPANYTVEIDVTQEMLLLQHQQSVRDNFRTGGRFLDFFGKNRVRQPFFGHKAP